VFKNKKILLLEAATQKKQQQLPDTFNSRVCALSGGTIRLLDSTFPVFACAASASISNRKCLEYKLQYGKVLHFSTASK